MRRASGTAANFNIWGNSADRSSAKFAGKRRKCPWWFNEPFKALSKRTLLTAKQTIRNNRLNSPAHDNVYTWILRGERHVEMLPSAASFFFFSSFPTPLCIPVVPFSFSSRTNARFYPDKRDKKRGILVEKFLRRCESFWGRFFLLQIRYWSQISNYLFFIQIIRSLKESSNLCSFTRCSNTIQ